MTVVKASASGCISNELNIFTADSFKQLIKYDRLGFLYKNPFLISASWDQYQNIIHLPTPTNVL